MVRVLPTHRADLTSAIVESDVSKPVTIQARCPMRSLFKAVIILGLLLTSRAVTAAPLTDPDDPRSWQGATVGTFAQLYFGANTLANRQMVIDLGLLDDGLFNATGTTGNLINATGIASCGTSLDTTGTGSLDYTIGCTSFADAANGIDAKWIQSSGVVGQTVWDLGFDATKAAIFNTIDHGPLPQEAIESTGYLSNDLITWTPAVVERVWLEGFMANTGILWDGFAFAVGTGTDETFRYISIIHGGPGGLQSDGDDEINGVMGLDSDFHPDPHGSEVPEPASMLLVASGLIGAGVRKYRGRRS